MYGQNFDQCPKITVSTHNKEWMLHVFKNLTEDLMMEV